MFSEEAREDKRGKGSLEPIRQEMLRARGKSGHLNQKRSGHEESVDGKRPSICFSLLARTLVRNEWWRRRCQLRTGDNQPALVSSLNHPLV